MQMLAVASIIRFMKIATRLLLGAAFIAIYGSCAGAQNSPAQVAKYVAAARDAAKAGASESAAENYREAVKLAPRDAALHNEYGTVLISLGRLTDAAAEFQMAIALSSKNEAARLGLAEVYRQLSNYDEARRQMERARREHPSSPLPLVALGRLDIQLEKYDLAISNLNAVLKLNRGDSEARNSLATAYQARGDAGNALEQVNRVLAKHPGDALALYLRGEIHADRNENAQALADAEASLVAKPEVARTRILLATVAVRLNQCARAAEVLAPIPTPDSKTLYLLSRAYRCAGNDPLAQRTAEQFQQAQEAEHAATEDEVAAGHLVEQAAQLAQKNQLPQSLELLQQAVAKDARSGSAWLQMAKDYFSENEMEKASEAIEHALAIHPYGPENLYVLGRIQERGNENGKALDTFQTVVTVDPRESDAWYEIGIIHMKLSEYPQAQVAFRHALDISPRDADYQRAYEESIKVAGMEKDGKN